MLELVEERRRLDPLIGLAAAFDVGAVGIALKEPFRALHQVNPAVRARQIGAVLHHDRPSLRRLDQARVHVAEYVLFASLRGARRKVLNRPFLQAA
jgi:hypothetical protein